jgi:hypothetical protein
MKEVQEHTKVFKMGKMLVSFMILRYYAPLAYKLQAFFLLHSWGFLGPLSLAAG